MGGPSGSHRIARYHQDRDLLHHHGTVLIQGLALEADDSAIRARPRRASFEDLAFDVKKVARVDGMRPADLFDADTDQSADDPELALDHQTHRDRGSVPATGHESPEKAGAGGFIIKVKRLRVELGRKGRQPVLFDRDGAGAKRLSRERSSRNIGAVGLNSSIRNSLKGLASTSLAATARGPSR